jgi:RHS repeat-associated protein
VPGRERDVLGNRIAKKVNGTVTRFVWRSGHVLYETTDGGTVTYSYQWGLATDDLLALHDHGAAAHYYVVQDRLRTVRGLVNRDGTWVAAWRYRAYGTPLDSSGTAAAGLKRFRWAGAQYDAETGFYFLRSRYYDPTVGRFVQEDKLGRAGAANLYAYAGGDPVVARDPGGTRKSFDYYYGYLNVPSGGGGGWGDWTCVPDAASAGAFGVGGCAWMPPGLSDAMVAAFVGGVAELGYPAYVNNFNMQKDLGVFADACVSYGSGDCRPNSITPLRSSQYDKIVTGLASLAAQGRQGPWASSLLGNLLAAGRFAVNDWLLKDQYDWLFRSDAPASIVWVHGVNLLLATPEGVEQGLAHEAGHFSLWGDARYRDLWRDECQAELFAWGITGRFEQPLHGPRCPVP